MARIIKHMLEKKKYYIYGSINIIPISSYFSSERARMHIFPPGVIILPIITHTAKVISLSTIFKTRYKTIL